MLGSRRPYHYGTSVLVGFKGSVNRKYYMIRQQKSLKGSILVFTLLVLAILLSAALSSAGIVITGKNSSRATEKSALAFQIADGAAENVLKRVYKDTDSTLSQLASNLYRDGNGTGAPGCQTGGVITGTLPGASGTYSVAFFDNNGAPLACSGTGYSTHNEWRTKLVRIVASGSYAGATRAIDVTVKPQACTDATVDYSGVTYDTIAIGTQCWMKQNMRVGTRINNSTAQTNNGTVEKYCYNNDTSNECAAAHPTEPDGGLYTWDEAMQYSPSEGAQGICPSGWHIPTDDDWFTLESYLDPTVPNPHAGCTSGGTTVGTQLMPGGSSGFEANYAGGVVSGASADRNTAVFFWTSKEDTASAAWTRALLSGSSYAICKQNVVKSEARTVRCIKD